MGKAISYIVRVKIVEQRKRGVDYATIAAAYDCSTAGVKKIWYDFQKRGEAAFETKYHNCGGVSVYGQEIREKIVEVRDNEQGGAYVRSKLQKKYPELQIPNERTMQRWWAKAGSSRKRGRPTRGEKKDGAK